MRLVHSSLLGHVAQGESTLQKYFISWICRGWKRIKMSKSLGNVISPEDILKNYGADILRVWTAASDYSRISE